ncbi:DUF4227 family protein [Paenibacillus sp. SYP-B4298]|uniref:DUF4227 family protein n=1 Tax=Paenibacillus sp. SYP-B4298 TaxID=2996034 RepID=UPI0022DDF30E|nr:DUF4227 family protein [Paenibacillus sp. SYP-B4298]
MMVVSLRKTAARLLFLILFVLLTLIVFGGYRYLMVKLMLMDDPYEAPRGQAVKVFQPDEAAFGEATVKERLRWFYLFGE